MKITSQPTHAPDYARAITITVLDDAAAEITMFNAVDVSPADAHDVTLQRLDNRCQPVGEPEVGKDLAAAVQAMGEAAANAQTVKRELQADGAVTLARQPAAEPEAEAIPAADKSALKTFAANMVGRITGYTPAA